MSSPVVYPSYKLSEFSPKETVAKLRSDVCLKPMIMKDNAAKKLTPKVNMMYVNSKLVYRGDITCTLGKTASSLDEAEMITQKFETTLEDEKKQKMSLVFKFQTTSLIEKNVEALEQVIAERFTEQIWKGVEAGEPMFAPLKSWVNGLNDGKRPYSVDTATDETGGSTTSFSGPLYDWVLECMKSRLTKHELWGSGLKLRAWGNSDRLSIYGIEFKNGEFKACDDEDRIYTFRKGIMGMAAFEVKRLWFKCKDGRKQFKGVKVLEEWGTTFTLKTFGVLERVNKDASKLEASAQGLIDGMVAPPKTTSKYSRKRLADPPSDVDALGEPPAKKPTTAPGNVRVVAFTDDVDSGNNTFDANLILTE